MPLAVATTRAFASVLLLAALWRCCCDDVLCGGTMASKRAFCFIAQRGHKGPAASAGLATIRIHHNLQLVDRIEPRDRVSGHLRRAGDAAVARRHRGEVCLSVSKGSRRSLLFGCTTCWMRGTGRPATSPTVDRRAQRLPLAGVCEAPASPLLLLIASKRCLLAVSDSRIFPADPE